MDATPEIKIEERHRAAARKYDVQSKTAYVSYSWAPVWDGVKFVVHAWDGDGSTWEHPTWQKTACGIAQPYPKTYVVSSCEPHCEKCRDAILEPLALAFAACEAERPSP
jgi:hypothetical protein